MLLAFSFPGWNLLKDAILSLLTSIHDSLGVTWAISIILMTLVVRLILEPLSAKAKISMLAMQRVAPYAKQIQEKYKGDREEMQRRLMEFYRDNNVNPVASCLPLLLQLPVMFAIFTILRDFAKDPPPGDMHFLGSLIPDITMNTNDVIPGGYILLIFYVGSQLFASKVMATSPDPRQRMIMMFLPIAFVPFLLSFPVGLILYFITTNLWTLGEHVIISKLVGRAPKEIVMPADAKGRKRTKTDKPKTDKPKNDTSSGKPGGKPNASKDTPQPGRRDDNDQPKRRNKRRK